MLQSRVALVGIASLVGIAALAGSSRAGVLTASATCAGGTGITFSWSFYEDPALPTGHAEWVGYDVRRRSISPCSPFIRVSAHPYPRTPGATENFTYTEVPPISGRTYEYQVVLVDANRQEISPGLLACECYARNGWASCPEFSAPLTQGTLEDWGWALHVQPCPGTCYDAFYFEGPLVAELRPYAGTGVPVRLYGSGFCGTVEGCAMNVAYYDFLSPCGSTPALRSSWGRVKAIYR
jgi:hypothetical protein